MPEALPADAVLVHVGPYKTGTTAMQSTFAGARAALAEHGVLYPGTRVAQHTEARALRQYAEGWGEDAYAAPDPAVWERLVHRVRATPGRVLLSSEYFGDADAADRARLVDDLGPERVHIVAGVRNPAGLAVSNWQQTLRKGRPLSLEKWLESTYRREQIRDDSEGFWSRADASAFTTRFAEVVAPERITLVVLDGQDRRLLPATFEQLLALPAGLLADATPKQNNRGLSAAEAALLLRVITLLGSQLTWTEYSAVVRRGVVRRLLETRVPGEDEPRAELPQWALDQAAAEVEHMIEKLRDSRVQIVGELDALRTMTASSDAATAPAGVPVDAAAEAVVGAISAGVTGSWDLAARTSRAAAAAPRRVPQRKAAHQPAPPRGVDALSDRELAAELGRRVRARVRRRP